MGQYLSAPETRKESEEGQNEQLTYGLSAMQGWRVSMEDDHIAILDLDGSTGTALFSVFDGHGGKAVAKFAARHLPRELMQTEAYARGNLGQALIEAYYSLDVLMDTDAGKAELRELAGGGNKAPLTLFSDVEAKLGSDAAEEQGPPAAAPADADGAPALQAEAEAAPLPPVAERRVRKLDSSKDFLQSHLMRASVLPPSMTGGPGDEDSVLNGLAGSSGASSSGGEGEEAHHAGGMGCTALSMLVRGTNITVANTGDSRCVLSRNGQAMALTLDHKPILFDEARRIIKAGGFVRDNRINGALNVSRTLGDLDFKRNDGLPHTEQMVVATPDIEQVQLKEGDEFALLACDGIWDVLSNQEAVDFVRKRLKSGQSPKSICEDMCDECLAPDLKGLCRGADNMSAIVVVFRKHARLEGSFSRALGGMWRALGGKRR